MKNEAIQKRAREQACPRIAIVIPAYNEASTISQVVTHCLRYSDNIVVIDDGSTDETFSVIQQLSIHRIQQPNNEGKGKALLTGFSFWAQHAVCGVVTLDADGQHDPEDLPRFFAQIAQTPDAMIIGARTINAEAAPKVRWFANKLADFFISVAAKRKIKDTQSGFRYYPMSFLSYYLQQKSRPQRFAFEVDVLVAAMKMDVSLEYVNIQSSYPKTARKSHYHPLKDSWRIVKTIVRMMLKK